VASAVVVALVEKDTAGAAGAEVMEARGREEAVLETC